MQMTVRALLLGLLVAVHLAAAAAAIDVSPYVGTWRVVRDGTVMSIRIDPDGGVAFISPNDGSSILGKAMAQGANGSFGGMLDNGQAFALGSVKGVPALSLGDVVLTLQSLSQAPAPSESTLAGLRLSMAKGKNGYFMERSYDFCADGRVFTRWAESQMSQFGSGVSERKDQGTWRLKGAALELNLARGGTMNFAVQRPEARVVRLDATAYAVEQSARCR